METSSFLIPIKRVNLRYMEENNKVEIKLQRHLWPDEQEERNERKKQKRNRLLTLLLVVFLMAASLGLGIYLGKMGDPVIIYVPTNDGKSGSMERLDSIYRILKEKWYFADSFENKDEELINRAIRGMIGSDVDPHTSYLDPEETQEFYGSIDDRLVGIGVSYSISGDVAVVESVYFESPAYKAGMKTGDMINMVDGNSVAGWTSDDFKNAVRGEEGSVVNIGYLRNGEQYFADITRGVVETTVFGEMREDTGYLQLLQFSSNAPQQVEALLQHFQSEHARYLLIDVRDDGGGFLTSIVGIANLLLDKNMVIMSEEYTDQSKNTEIADGKNVYSFERIVILGNEDSASASEALIAALKENNKAVFVGTRTYGKSTIQVPSYFSDGSTLKYTHGMWKTPLGNVINNVGIEPDEEVRLHPILYSFIPVMEEDAEIKADSVSEEVVAVQQGLDFLGYEVDRFDGYFSLKTQKAVNAFRKDNDLEENGVVDEAFCDSLFRAVQTQYNADRSAYDTQYQRAWEILHEPL